MAASRSVTSDYFVNSQCAFAGSKSDITSGMEGSIIDEAIPVVRENEK